MLRDATPEDVSALAALAAGSYRVAFKAILEPEALAQRGEAFFEAYFAETLPNIRVAVESGAGAGAVAAFAKTTNGHLDMLFTDAAFQGRGFGDALLADAVARGARSLEAFEANAPARAFYEKRGWRLTRSYSRAFVGRTRAFVFYQRDEP